MNLIKYHYLICALPNVDSALCRPKPVAATVVSGGHRKFKGPRDQPRRTVTNTSSTYVFLELYAQD